jgi:uncharacterized protein (TIGR00369 family)
MKVANLSPGCAIIEFEATNAHANPMGTLHGGVLCSIADVAIGVALSSTLGEDETFTTIDLNINFLRPFWTGTLCAKGHVLRAGKTLGLIECDISDDKERLIARASSTCMILRGQKAEGRHRAIAEQREIPKFGLRRSPRRLLRWRDKVKRLRVAAIYALTEKCSTGGTH